MERIVLETMDRMGFKGPLNSPQVSYLYLMCYES